MAPRPTDYASVVRANHARTTGYLAASSGDCIGLRDTEVTRIRRTLAPLSFADLAKIDTARSWLLGILVCPEDDLAPVATWTARLPQAQRGRVRFYAHPDADLVDVFAPWYDEELDDPRVATVGNFATFHRSFGNDLNDQIYEDAQAGGA